MIERKDRTPIMHRAVKNGGTLYIGGTAASDMSLDMTGQAREVFQKLEAQLVNFGSDRTKLLSVTIFVSDLTLKSQMNDVWKEWLQPEDMPARATIGAGDLGEGCLIEVTAIAAV